MEVGMKTHIGCVRTNNEDAYFVRWPILAVADGMGGHEAGEVASAAAVEALQRTVFGTSNPANPLDRLQQSVRAAHLAMAKAAAEDASLRNMGTTLTAAFFTDKEIFIAHVGDSRAYLWRNGTLIRLTTDHSVTEELVRAGQLDEQAAAHHPHRHVLTRAVSAHAVPEVDMITVERRPGDTLVLCTDGLTVHVSDKEIEAVLQRHGRPQEVVDELVRQALERGGTDNVTVVVAQTGQPEVIR